MTTDYVIINGVAHRFRGYGWPFIETQCGRSVVNAKTTSGDPKEPRCTQCENAIDYPDSATRPDVHDYGPREEDK